MTNPETYLSEHFQLKEFTASTSYPDIYNVPSPGVVENLRVVAQWLEEMRSRYNRAYMAGRDTPVVVSSGYRSIKFNRAVGGTKESNHLYGYAADLRCRDLTQAIRYAALLLDISMDWVKPFDELIIERRYNRYWLHFAVCPTRNRLNVTFIDKRK